MTLFGSNETQRQHVSAKDYAIEYLAAGISVLPLKCDGSKKPSINSWKELQSRLATDSEINEWFADELFLDNIGIGVITGKVSGNLEVIDFDMHQLLPPVLSMLPMTLKDKLSIYETPGGWHVAYRCEKINGNTKIAMWETIRTPSRKGYGPSSLDLKGVRIETRGEGGYIVAEGSPCAVHSTGIPYAHYMGPRLESVQTISADERKLLWVTCNQFDLSNQVEEQANQNISQLQPRHYKAADDDTPWAWFDFVGNWDWILLPLGWTKCGPHSYTRPGKTSGVSATVFEHDGLQLLKIWSTSANGSQFKSLGKFNALAELKFNGNTVEATKYVRDLMKGHA